MLIIFGAGMWDGVVCMLNDILNTDHCRVRHVLDKFVLENKGDADSSHAVCTRIKSLRQCAFPGPDADAEVHYSKVAVATTIQAVWISFIDIGRDGFGGCSRRWKTLRLSLNTVKRTSKDSRVHRILMGTHERVSQTGKPHRIQVEKRMPYPES